MNYTNLILSTLILFIFSCSDSKPVNKHEKLIENLITRLDSIPDKEEIEPKKPEIVSEDSPFEKLINKLPLKQIPCIDSTNFDNFVETSNYSFEELEILNTKFIYRKHYGDYKIFPSYRLDLSNEFRTIVVTSLNGDEMESVLINYDLKGEIVDFKVVSYDEIAEGWSRIESEISSKLITVTDILWTEEKQIKIERFSLNRFGEITIIPNEFKSNIRPREVIKLHKTFIDTIRFSDYNDDGDYMYLNGKKGNEKISLAYNWDKSATDQYNFNFGDYLEIKWQMDSTWIAGDGETLYFTEWVVNAKYIDEALLSANDAISMNEVMEEQAPDEILESTSFQLLDHNFDMGNFENNKGIFSLVFNSILSLQEHFMSQLYNSMLFDVHLDNPDIGAKQRTIGFLWTHIDRSPESIQALYTENDRRFIYAIFKDNNLYKSTGMQCIFEGLILAHEEFEGKEHLLESFYLNGSDEDQNSMQFEIMKITTERMKNIVSDKNYSTGDHKSEIDNRMFFVYSFWVRRHHEGNADIIFEIIKDFHENVRKDKY